MTELKAGDWVEVRSKEEILRTLDSKGELDGMLFMPEMFQFCGQKLQVYKRAHKTCDTVFPIRGRRVDSAVHLDTRCSGEAHGGCQAGCLLFWKEAWLKPLGEDSRNEATDTVAFNAGCTESDVYARTLAVDGRDGAPTYNCQATRLPYATKDLQWWELSQYVEDYTSKNVSLWRMFNGLVYMVYYNLSRAGIGLGRPMRWFNDKFHRLWNGTPWPRQPGVVPIGQPTPAQDLNLQPGELVRVKSQAEILQTVSVWKKNRGMWWDAEMVPYCGGTYRVLRRVDHIIDERTGKMLEMKTPCIILDSVVCQSRYSECRMFCPRSIYPYWREIWLERVGTPTRENELVELVATHK